ncbi:hypothetical protein VB773_04830 [Haloarculaceae archaeon H-GB2-1]|nr:hypothetical protein [Haloarculaceae archaeon H-GB1-1]MEA5388917.1 hypothetical protein [Haloarculaceae archaeon H-GB11]MEA5406967.1 hypothetical protein [Haloarculaceae archaeon H-GB2-1]
MSIWIDLARLATLVTLVLLAILGAVWGRNYLQLRSKHTLGMLVFAALLIVENGFALYVYQLDPVLSLWFSTKVPDPAWQAMSAFHILELVAIAFLTWVTLD